MAPADGELGAVSSGVDPAAEKGLEEELKREAVKAVEHLVASSIGEGESGIVVNFDDPRFSGYCMKYHKIEYKPEEFRNLQLAFSAGKQVPRPVFEVPEKHAFVMEKIKNGKTLKELRDAGCKFLPEIMEEIEEIAKDFCQHFTHNDFFDRNIMLENVVIEDKIVIEGTPIIIDLERMEKGYSDEFRRVRGWFRNRLAAS